MSASLSESALTAEPLASLDELAHQLSAAGLPMEDIGGFGRSFFRYRDATGSVVALGGLEPLGRTALLRSIVVLPPARSQGVGRTVVAHLLAEADRGGASDAYLITSTALPFFMAVGFAIVERSDAPSVVLATRQAAGICADTAPLMRRGVRAA